ncbi:MAG: hypothetical protein ACRDKW_15265, partial [Actinomycetota bacterium]
GVYADLDYVSHYCMTAGITDVPVHLLQTFERREPWIWTHPDPGIGIIAEVEVELRAPVAPYRHPSLGVLYPIGRFRTTLAGPELDLVREHGRIVKWIRGGLYTLRPVLNSWAEWLLPQVTGPTAERDELVRRVLKDWTRSLIGKFGQRAPTTARADVEDAPAEPPEITVDLSSGSSELPWMQRAPDDPLRGQDATLAFPAITAWIHSAARVWLWGGMTTAGLEDLAYVDTDGFLVRVHQGNLTALQALNPRIDTTAASATAALPVPKVQRRRPTIAERRQVTRGTTDEIPTEDPRPGTMAVKGTYAEVRIHRPQDYELDQREVIKGLPRARKKIGERTWEAEFWPGIVWHLQHGKPGTYVRPTRTVHLGEDYLRGWVLSDGRVVPLEVRWENRDLAIVPWSRTGYR